MALWMSLFFGVILLIAWGSLVRSWYQVETQEDEIHFIQTEDHWRIGCSRYRARGTARSVPVVLCHGLASNRTTFDLTSEHSLARYLANEGFDVWLIDLRGHGYSTCPSIFNGHRYGWSFDDYVMYDIPAALKHIREQTGSQKVHWVGHSMGGMLLYAHMSRLGTEPFQSGTTVASSLDFSQTNSQFAGLSRWLWLTRPLSALPFGHLSLLVAPFARRFNLHFERFLYWPKNIVPEVARLLLVNTCHAISRPVAVQLSSVFKEGGVTWKDESNIQRYYLEGLGNVALPVLAIAGDHDVQCPPDAVQLSWSAIQHKDKQYTLFGPEAGHREHYGHFDLLLGQNATYEVFPEILQWLVRHDTNEDSKVILNIAESESVPVESVESKKDGKEEAGRL